jgi:hypothetical protein
MDTKWLRFGIPVALWLWAGPVQATDLYSEGGFRFDVQDGLSGSWTASGVVSDGSRNAYDSCYYLNVNGRNYDGSAGGSAVLDGRTIRFPEVRTDDGLILARQAHVPETGGDYIRYFDTIKNTTTATISVNVEIKGNLGSDSTTTVWGSYSGDTTVDASDYWFGTDDVPYSATSAGDPTLAHVFYGDGASVVPTSLSLVSYGSGDDLLCTYVVDIEPDQVVAFVTFGIQGNDEASVLSQVEEIVANFGLFVTDLSSEELGQVVNWSADADGDGFMRGNGPGEDCDDDNDQVYPGAEEVCDGHDNDCNGEMDEGFERSSYYPDGDGDGFGSTDDVVLACEAPPGYVTRPGDCDDYAPDVHPGCTEYCDSIDNDCDGEVDEDIVDRTYYVDSDQDGYGTGGGVTSCVAMPGWSVTGGDCDDSCPTCYPGAEEVCDGLDNNCNNRTDEGLESTIYYRDSDGDGHGLARTEREDCVARPGWVTSNDDCDDRCVTCYPGAEEVCDSLDNDCDGAVDEELLYRPYFQDDDGDGYGVPGTGREDCVARPGWANRGEDCNDSCATCFPGAEEICDGLDNDCNGEADETLSFVTYYRDSDGDGFGVDASATTTCREMPSWALQGGDCDDRCATCYPGADEVCDGVDNNCDGAADEGLVFSVWADEDGDGYGNRPSHWLVCEATEGYVTNADDCHDANAEVHPGREEVCDGYDNDCNGEVDEGVTSLWYADTDNDGFGSDETRQACEQLPGWVAESGDCDDRDPLAYPGAEEVVGDERDNNCDGNVDELPEEPGEEDGGSVDLPDAGEPDKETDAGGADAGPDGDPVEAPDAGPASDGAGKGLGTGGISPTVGCDCQLAVPAASGTSWASRLTQLLLGSF